jgi:aminopeptidase N
MNFRLNPNDKATIYCHGIRHFGETEWNFLLDHFSRTVVASEKILVLNALSCSEDPIILTKYLDMIVANVGDTFKKTEAVIALTALSFTNAGRPLVIEKITSEWDTMSPL